MIQLNDEQYWLYAAVDPDTNEFLHAKLKPVRNNALAVKFFAGLREKHDIDDAVFLIDDAPQLHSACQRHGLNHHVTRHGDRNSVKRIIREVKRGTSSFSNCFSNARRETADEWLRCFAFAWNQLI